MPSDLPKFSPPHLLVRPSMLPFALLLAVATILLQSRPAVANVAPISGFRVPIRRIPRLRPSLSTGNVLTTDVAINNRNEFTYLVSVSVGGQELSVILDTGSSDFWVVSAQCSTSDCNGITKYIADRSSSLTLSDKNFKLSYLTGSVTVFGTVVTFTCFSIAYSTPALANRTQGLDLSSAGNSGILGLSFSSIAAISLADGNTLLDNIFSNFDEPDRFFAFKLGRGSGPDDVTSSFTIGELDETISSDLASFSFTTVSKAGADSFNYWKLPLQSLTIDNTTFSLSPSLVPGSKSPVAVLDTGTTLILGPTRDVEAFWRSADQDATRRNDMSGLWEIRCDRGISVSFSLGEKGNERAFPIDPGDINWEEGGSEAGWCIGGIQANDGVNSGDWLLGDVFLRNVYVTHHSANSTHQPLIGLLSMTDPLISMSQFRKERGPEQSQSTTPWTRQHIHKEASPMNVLVCN
ncbi:hypothetical protein D9615_001652 [Tricholomella constricta]|uniref:Peptidase A1 domain-containing protein n=1 Tax=Tricholomella constricta TaxID=117010 RepID=A0A8H5HQ04_9AGAR|nr:hypothetical protein D9615_001652 [Tricholomella constricta]